MMTSRAGGVLWYCREAVQRSLFFYEVYTLPMSLIRFAYGLGLINTDILRAEPGDGSTEK